MTVEISMENQRQVMMEPAFRSEFGKLQDKIPAMSVLGQLPSWDDGGWGVEQLKIGGKTWDLSNKTRIDFCAFKCFVF